MTNKTELIISGHGGQGVLELANNLSYYELLKGRHVACTPSYGPESRGGKVKCYVVSSEGEIASPIVEEPDCLIVMNTPSMDFVPLLRNDGYLLMNSSLISEEPKRTDIRVFKIPATQIADDLKQAREFSEFKDTKLVANSVMFGAYLALFSGSFDRETLTRVFKHFLVDRKASFIPLNIAAAERGHEFAGREILTVSSGGG
jgi:2-oxoglutarate ferredoxin oxidoreductase subunit gamma